MKGTIVSKRKLNAAGEWEDSPAYFVDGKEVTEAEFLVAFPDKPIIPAAGNLGNNFGGQHAAGWPMYSDAMAVHPSQVAAANARNARHGVNVRYEPHAGLAIIPSEREKKKLMKLEGFHDRAAYS